MRAIAAPRLGTVLFDVAVAGAVAATAPLSTLTARLPAIAQVFGYVMAAALLVRRRWPLVTLAVVGLAALGQVLFVRPRLEPTPYDAAVLIAMFSAVKYGRRMLDAWLAAAVVAIGAGIEVQHRGSANWLTVSGFYVGVCGGIWLAGYTVRTRRIYVAGLEERAATLEREREHLARLAVADERATIARELHDVVAHSLAVMIVQADGGRYAMDTDPGRTRDALITVADTGREALADMRRLIGVLRGSDGDETEGAADRRRITVEQLDALVERARSAGLRVEVRLDGTPAALSPGEPTQGERDPAAPAPAQPRPAALDPAQPSPAALGPAQPSPAALGPAQPSPAALDPARSNPGALGPGALTPAVELAVYRIVQEALTNVLRHAGREAKVILAIGYRPDAVTLSVVDDGGPDPLAADPGAPGNGLLGMRERVAVHGGKFSAGPRLDGGWAVEATIPLSGMVVES